MSIYQLQILLREKLIFACYATYCVHIAHINL